MHGCMASVACDYPCLRSLNRSVTRESVGYKAKQVHRYVSRYARFVEVLHGIVHVALFLFYKFQCRPLVDKQDKLPTGAEYSVPEVD